MPSSRMPKSMAEKKEVVQWIEKNGGVPTPAAVYFKNERGWKVSEAQVRYWWQRTAIKAAPALRSRLSGAGAKPRLSEIEDILFDQVLFRRSEKEKVSRDWIRDAGQRLAASELGDTDFVASDRWVNGFMRRYGLSLRRTTNLTVLTDDVLTDRAVSFLSYLTSRIDGLSDDHIILMDETAVYFEDPRRQTMDQVGARHVVLKRTDTLRASGRYRDLQVVQVSFKDKLSPIIDSWKKSDAVLYTRGGNPKPPSVETVANWVNFAWRDVPADVVKCSVAAAGFSPRFGDWHVARHDVYGELFCSKWKERIRENADDVSDSGGALSEDCFDEFTIWDSEESVKD
ncbi:unnamed protein product [Phytophthora lilii]|uniref:Unnamed protein product n=1 Tax=Phytophthora lilii TaxID=2077276 RepID=A0A9W6WPH2_9STRA|nr:unnamed protein product [Phytophthora lilii]